MRPRQSSVALSARPRSDADAASGRAALRSAVVTMTHFALPSFTLPRMGAMLPP